MKNSRHFTNVNKRYHFKWLTKGVSYLRYFYIVVNEVGRPLEIWVEKPVKTVPTYLGLLSPEKVEALLHFATNVEREMRNGRYLQAAFECVVTRGASR